SSISVDLSITTAPYPQTKAPGQPDPAPSETNPFSTGIIKRIAPPRPPGAPAPTQCGVARLMGSWCNFTSVGEIEVNVYDENACGSKGTPIDHLNLHPNQPVRVDAPTSRVRYDYRVGPSDSFHGDVGAWCRNGENVLVP